MTDTQGTLKQGALAGIRIIDLTDERGIYGAKLLADLGAEVVRPEPVKGDPLRSRGPHLQGSDSFDRSLWFAFYASSRRFISLDLSDAKQSDQLQQLVEHADIVLTCRGRWGSEEFDREMARDNNPGLVIIETSSFGSEGPWRDYLAPDLVAGALGGFCATTGDIDTPPLKGFGDLNFMVSGAYVAIAALTGYFHACESKRGQQADVSVHESIVSCLEHVLMWYWYNDSLGLAESKSLPRRGSLHWSNAYQVMQAQGGSIMITPTPDAEAQIFWLVEEDAHEDLLDEKYYEPENYLELSARLMEILRKWVATKDVEQLFFEGQQRHSPYGWVLPIEKVAENPQLNARDWWQDYMVAGRNTRGPGAPYIFSNTPWTLGSSEPPVNPGTKILDDIGWSKSS